MWTLNTLVAQGRMSPHIVCGHTHTQYELTYIPVVCEHMKQCLHRSCEGTWILHRVRFDRGGKRGGGRGGGGGVRERERDKDRKFGHTQRIEWGEGGRGEEMRERERERERYEICMRACCTHNLYQNWTLMNAIC